MGMALSYILERKEILLKPNYMTNEEKAKEISMITWSDFEEIKKQNLNIGKYISDACLDMARWKDEQTKQLLIEKTKLLSPSASQDSVKRCTIEEIYRELFNEEMPNSNPYMK